MRAGSKMPVWLAATGASTSIDHMKMTSFESTASCEPSHAASFVMERVITAATIAALGLIVCIASARGAGGLSEMYGGTDQFRVVTLLAISAHRWAPFGFGVLLAGFIGAHSRRGSCRWASWSALSIAGLTTALVLYGLVLPFASTTFRMGSH